MDGVLEWSYVWGNQSYVIPRGTVLQPLVASHLAVIGRRPGRILASMGMGSRIHVIGLPRLDGLPLSGTTASRRRPIILIACARTASHNLDHDANVRRALHDLKSVAEELGLEVIWRIPPDLAIEIGITPSNEALSEVLNAASAVVTFTSTLALEAMRAGLPTAIVEYRPVPLYVESAWQIRSRDHVYPVFNELLHPPAEKIAYQEFCLQEELEDGSASERLASLVMQLGRGQLREEGTPASSSGALDFKLVHSQLSSFSASPNASLQYELDASRALRRLVADRMRELRATWQVRILRRLRKVPTFGKLNRLLDFYLD
jgi:hypothetical protein